RKHPDADRSRRADRARGEERDSDRRVREAIRGARRPFALRCGDCCGPHTPASDPDDVVRVHSRRAAARDRGGAGQGDASGARHGRVLRHDRRHVVRSDLYAGLLRRLQKARLAAEGVGMSGARLSIRGAALLSLVGCAVGPDYREPEPDPAARAPFAGADVDAFVPEPPRDDWWRLYDDPVLDAVVTEALDANTDLRAAAANLARANAVLREARGERLPATTFSAGSTSGRQNFVQQGFSFEDTIYDVGFDVSYQLDLFGRVTRAIQAARADAQAVEAVHRTVQITVAAETARAYVAACAARLELAAAERSLALQRETQALTERLYEAGRGTALDVARASAAAEQTRAAIPTLEAAHSTA